MRLVYETLDDSQKEESKNDSKVDFSKLTTYFQTQIEEKILEISNLKTELLNTKQSLAHLENLNKETQDKNFVSYKPADLLIQLN